MDNRSCYLNALILLRSMKMQGIINEKEYNQSEEMLAKKYCIKIVSLYRPMDLINSPFRAMYIADEKEVINNE